MKDRLKRLVVQANALTERVGVHVQPAHYYADIPDRRELAGRRAEWARPVDLSGIEWDLDAQLAWLRQVVEPYLAEVAGLEAYRAHEREALGPGFGPIESQVLHCVVRATAPARVVEVGSGVSTMVSRDAMARNRSEGRTAGEMVCIEPYPKPNLLRSGVRVVEQRLQEVDAGVFASLQAGDVLFIDSSHAVRTGSELMPLYLEILPRLAAGVFVHIHDIYLPYAYAPDVMSSLFDWQETTLVAALLTANPSLAVRCCLSALHDARQAELAGLMPDYQPRRTVDGLFVDGPESDRHFPASLWLETLGGAAGQ